MTGQWPSLLFQSSQKGPNPYCRPVHLILRSKRRALAAAYRLSFVSQCTNNILTIIFKSHPLQLMITEQSINDVYYRLLSSKKRGSPLWIPGMNKRLPIEYRRQGLGIGDVGVITERGFFDSLFNISLPCDHPLAINSDRLPDNFYPLNITPNDIQEYSEFNQGSFLSSASIKSSYKDDNSS